MIASNHEGATTALTSHEDGDHDDGEHDDHGRHDHSEADHDGHEAHEEAGDGHEGHTDGEEHDERIVRMSATEMEEFGIRLDTAQAGEIRSSVSLAGEVVLNTDQVAHVGPRVAGVVSEIHRHLGDQVETGDLLAVIDSRELAQARAAHVLARERLGLAQKIFDRAESLWQKKVASEQELLDAEQTLANARIEFWSRGQELAALGVAPAGRSDGTLTRYELRAPISGTIIAKHLTRGENASTDTPAFEIADLSTVWVHLTLYQKDLASVGVGQAVTILGNGDHSDASATIDYISPLFDEATRTGTARIVLDNVKGNWRPGMFVTGTVAGESVAAKIVVPRSALQNVDGETIVFARIEDGFAPQPVILGRSDAQRTEIRAGLMPGAVIAVANAFVLKSEIGKGSFGDGHAH